MTEFDADDLPLLNQLLARQPMLRDAAGLAKRVIKADRFPLESFDDLAGVLGGPEATINFRGGPMAIEDLRDLVPAYYFPIVSAKDFTAKIVDLGGRRAAPVTQQVEDAVTVRWSSERISVPADAPPPPRLSSHDVQQQTRDSLTQAGLAVQDQGRRV